MDFDSQVAKWLNDYRLGRYTDEKLAYRRALEQVRLDFTPESLRRMDALIAQIRKQHAPKPEQFMTTTATGNFVSVVSAYAGAVVRRYCGRPCRWLTYEQALAQLDKSRQQTFEPGFGNQYLLHVTGLGYFMPLLPLYGLFDTPPEGISLMAIADQFLRRVHDMPKLERAPSVDAALNAEWAVCARKMGVRAAMEAWVSLVNGSDLGPSYSQDMPNGQTLVVSLKLYGDANAAMDAGRSQLEHNSEGEERTCFIHDGYVGLQAFRTDMMSVSLRSFKTGLRVVIALPYRHAHHPLGFAWYAPRLIEFSGSDAEKAQFGAQFFAGFDSFKIDGPDGIAPGALWDKYHVDENDPANAAAQVQHVLPVADTQAARYVQLIEAGNSSDEERNYIKIQRPRWLAGSMVEPWFNHAAQVMREGRVVWAHLVQANEGLFEATADSDDTGRPGEIVYDPHGLTLIEDLALAANELFQLKSQYQTQPESLSAEQRAIGARYAEESRAGYGVPVPFRRLTHRLLSSSIYFHRAHLPQQYLAGTTFPVMVSGQHKGYAVVVPSRFWPQALLDEWAASAEQRPVQKWAQHWLTLAAGMSNEDRQAEQARVAELRRYANYGVTEERIDELQDLYGDGIARHHKPAPVEWEWYLDRGFQELSWYRTRYVEVDRAQGKGLNVTAARSAYAASVTGLWIALHRLLLAQARGHGLEHLQLSPDDIQYVALGLVAGCETPALMHARVLCAAWNRPQWFEDLLRPEVRVVFLLFARQLGITLPPMQPFKPLPALEALLKGDAWLAPDGQSLVPLMEAACVEHTREAPQGPFLGLPIALVLIQKLRATRGLSNAPVQHPLLAVPVQFGASVGLDQCMDIDVAGARARMQRRGFDENAISQAVLENKTLKVRR